MIFFLFSVTSMSEAFFPGAKSPAIYSIINFLPNQFFGIICRAKKRGMYDDFSNWNLVKKPQKQWTCTRGEDRKGKERKKHMAFNENYLCSMKLNGWICFPHALANHLSKLHQVDLSHWKVAPCQMSQYLQREQTLIQDLNARLQYLEKYFNISEIIQQRGEIWCWIKWITIIFILWLKSITLHTSMVLCNL